MIRTSPTSGHNSDAANHLRAFIERLERLEEERKTLADDIAEVYKELVSDGFDKEAAKTVLKIRRKDGGLNAWTVRSESVDLYLAALGMLPSEVAPRARAHPREIIEEFPAKTDESLGHAVETIVPAQQKENGESRNGEMLGARTPGVNDEGERRPQRQEGNAHRDGIAGNSGPVDAHSVTAGETAPNPEPFEPPAFLTKQDKPEANERCERPKDCKFSHHPQKVTCSTCKTAWDIARRKSREAA